MTVRHTLLAAYPGPDRCRMRKRLQRLLAVDFCSDLCYLFPSVPVPLCHSWQHHVQPTPLRCSQTWQQEGPGHWSSERRCGNKMYGKCAGTGRKCLVDVCWLGAKTPSCEQGLLVLPFPSELQHLSSFSLPATPGLGVGMQKSTLS